MPRRGVLSCIYQPGSRFAVSIQNLRIFALTWEAVVISLDRKEQRFRESTQLKRRT